MKNFKYTKGPWYVSQRDGDNFIWNVENPNNPVAKCFSVYEDDNGKANANLICAAPEMLSALETVLPLLEAYENGPWQDARELVENVINKAKGG